MKLAQNGTKLCKSLDISIDAITAVRSLLTEPRSGLSD